ncbi:MAG: hypothetical protein Q9190_006748 [Brigantiaea leucoxantha]
MPESPRLDFCTFGMFILDEIFYRPPRLPDINVMGGAGLYAALGARLFRPSHSASKVGWIIHRGLDFTNEMEQQVESWKTDCNFIDTPERQTTRGLNVYETDGRREQGRDPTIAELSNSSRLEQSFVWEPVPDLCIPSELEKTKEALKWIDVMSPNLEEFATLLDDTFDLDNIFDREKLRKQCEMLLSVDQNQKCRTIVVRLGEQGCYIAQPAKEKYLPAYYIGGQAQEHVMDATGSGNAFLGGFCVGLLDHSGCIEDAVAYGTVAASFALEQVGVPELTCAEIGSDELWNGESVKVRMKKYQERIAYL